MAVAHTHELDEGLIDALDWLAGFRDKRAEGIDQARANAAKQRAYADEVTTYFFTREAAQNSAAKFDSIADTYTQQVMHLNRILQEFGR
jgi:hypothetical protein